MIKSIAFMMASSLLASSAMAAPAPAPSESPSFDAMAMMKDEMAHLGKDAEHAYVIPYCGAPKVSISTLNASYVEKTDESGNQILPDTVEIMMVPIPTPIDMSAYDCSRGALIFNMQFPIEYQDWATQMNFTGLLFTSNSSEPFSPERLTSDDIAERISMNLAFSFMAGYDIGTYDSDNATDGKGPIYSVITVPYVKIPIPENLTSPDALVSTTSIAETGRYLTEMGFIISKDESVDVNEIYFSDISLICLPYPNAAQMEGQNITFYKNETAPGVFELSPALAAATGSY